MCIISKTTKVKVLAYADTNITSPVTEIPLSKLHNTCAMFYATKANIYTNSCAMNEYNICHITKTINLIHTEIKCSIEYLN